MSSGQSQHGLHLLLTGKMGSGKGWAAAHLRSAHGATTWTRTELMKRLAHAVIDGIGHPDDVLGRIFEDPDDREELRHELLDYAASYVPEVGKPRRLYQDIVAICQDRDPLCFERELAQRIAAVEAVSDVDLSVIDDVRILDAFNFFRDQGYITVRLTCDDATRKQRMLKRDGYLPSDATFNHPSETELDDVKHDFVIDNGAEGGTELYRHCDLLIAGLRSGELVPNSTHQLLSI